MKGSVGWAVPSGGRAVHLLRGSESEKRLRDECLNQEVFLSVTEARVVIEEWRSFYNRVHPHSGLGFQSADDFARTTAQLKPVPGT